jgi:CDP-diglyceride synthetase
MQFKALNRGELIAVAGGLLLGVSLFLAWYSLGNQHALLNGCKGPNTSCTGWHALSIARYVLLLAAVAPMILGYIIMRGHALSWPRGELTAVIALVALTLTLFRGVLDRPGSPPGQISVAVGWWVGLAAGLLILVGSVWRSQESAGRRKPPGVL